MRAVPSCDVRSHSEYTGLTELLRSDNPTLAAIQVCIRAWQKAGANEAVTPLVLADIRRILNTTA